MQKTLKQIKAIEMKNKHLLKDLNPDLADTVGIYFLTREDEDGIKYAYVGQAQKILTRLAQHLVGYQHIDLSLKKHGLRTEENPYGWMATHITCEIQELDAKEQYYIKRFADNGYQLRNKTAGGQGTGKRQIDEYRPAKGYRDGLRQGRKNLARELSAIIDKHLVVSVCSTRAGNKVSERMLAKFFELLKGDEPTRDGDKNTEKMEKGEKAE